MDRRTRFRRLKEISVQKGLRLTPQRLALLDILSQTVHHPTADELYQRVKRKLPSVSRATVYRNVQTLVKTGLLSTLEKAGDSTLYDTNPDEHHHFTCESCGKIFDVYLDEFDYTLDEPKSQLKNFRVERCEVLLRGVCPKCQTR